VNHVPRLRLGWVALGLTIAVLAAGTGAVLIATMSRTTGSAFGTTMLHLGVPTPVDAAPAAGTVVMLTASDEVPPSGVLATRTITDRATVDQLAATFNHMHYRSPVGVFECGFHPILNVEARFSAPGRTQPVTVTWELDNCLWLTVRGGSRPKSLLLAVDLPGLTTQTLTLLGTTLDALEQQAATAEGWPPQIASHICAGCDH
jgi:hypothetical protein